MNRFDLGLTGHPLSHSISPALHEASLAATGMSGRYRLYPVPDLPAGAPELEQLIDWVRRGDLAGLNVTIPHKRNVIPLLDRLAPAAAAAGAVNTIFFNEGALIGDNTDVEGFRRDLKRVFDLAPGTALILGAGGAARAVASALLADGWRVRVVARRSAQADSLARDLPGVEAVPGLPPDEVRTAADRPALIINATPLGMAPETGDSPWPIDRRFPEGCAVYDLVYNPQETAFLRLARTQGAPAAGGMGMLVEQAALAFEIWTGRRPPVEHLREAAQIAIMAMRKEIP